LGWAFVEAANLICRYDQRAKRWHARKLAKSNKVITIKALACKLAKALWHILSEGSLSDGDRLFGTAKKSATAAARGKPFGRAPSAKLKGLNSNKSQGLIGEGCSPTTYFHDWKSKSIFGSDSTKPRVTTGLDSNRRKGHPS
jgi:hypothetical protein